MDQPATITGDDADPSDQRIRYELTTVAFRLLGCREAEHGVLGRVHGFAPFPFMPRVVTGAFGAVYEIRDYHLLPGGLPATIAGWRVKLPVRHRVDPVSVVMNALDGPARIVHIWPFPGLDERVAVRRRLYEDGDWPPPGGPEHIMEATSTMAWPLPGSPLH